MNFILNQKNYCINDGASITDLIDKLDIGEQKIALEKNLQIITRSLWQSTKIKENDKIEIVRAIGGG
ncbi:MAG: thiamine biosynthesis protein ThiS [Gammaproteobacteria bacterium]|nr:MAG: thiamine biosynthesis protein ThiS [Gammaproteobacteria bacterium]